MARSGRLQSERAPRYLLHLVNGVEKFVPPGAYRFPQNELITELDASAKASLENMAKETEAMRLLPHDPILWGKWRD